jgi:hypothetical protein
VLDKVIAHSRVSTFGQLVAADLKQRRLTGAERIDCACSFGFDVVAAVELELHHARGRRAIHFGANRFRALRLALLGAATRQSLSDTVHRHSDRPWHVRRRMSRLRAPSVAGLQFGHRAESGWHKVLLDWLPPQYDIGKRKYLLLETEDGPAATKEHDLVVFHPHYPMHLREKEGILASGVAAVFSVKRTINRKEIVGAYKDAAILRAGMKIRDWTPRECLAPPVFFGLVISIRSACFGSWSGGCGGSIYRARVPIGQGFRAISTILFHTC